MSFPANFPGVCAECEQGFLIGDEIERLEWAPGWVHASCPPVKQAEVCPRCFIEKSVSGACGCYE